VRRIFLLVFSFLIAGACLGLGFWQLGRLSARRATNRAALAGRGLPVLRVDGPGIPVLQANRRAELAGTLDEGHEFLLRGRVILGVPAILVVTPLRLPGSDTAVLVNRGYVPAPDAVDPGSASWSEPGPLRLHGVLLGVPDDGDGAPMKHGSRETWKRLDLRAMRSRLPYPLAAVYLVAEPGSAGDTAHTTRGRAYPFRADPPPLSEGPHLMYAVQWFGIAAAVAAFAVLFVWRRRPGPAGER